MSISLSPSPKTTSQSRKNSSIYNLDTSQISKGNEPRQKALVSMENVHISHANKALLTIDKLFLPREKLVAFIGPNGAGKSTLLHAILGRHTGTGLKRQGEIFINGQMVSQVINRGEIAWVGQHERFGLPLTTLDYALLGVAPNLSWYQTPNKNHIVMAKQLLQDFELLRLAKARIETLSGGEKQRLAIVRALMQDTDILMFDEPTNHLDIRHQRFLLRYLHKLVQNKGKSILVVLHDLTHAYRYSDAVILLNKGQIVAQGTPSEVMTSQQLSEVYHVDITAHQTSDGLLFG